MLLIKMVVMTLDEGKRRNLRQMIDYDKKYQMLTKMSMSEHPVLRQDTGQHL